MDDFYATIAEDERPTLYCDQKALPEIPNDLLTPPPSANFANTYLQSSPSHLDTFKWFDVIIFELNNVFLQRSGNVSSNNRLKDVEYDIVTSSPWSKFERNLIHFSNCKMQLAGDHTFGFSEDEVATAMNFLMSWQESPEIVSLIRHLRNSHTICAIGNLPQDTFDGLQTSSSHFEPFNEVFVSCHLRERLPHPATFTKILSSSEVDPQRTLYIGSDIDSRITARSFGFHTIQYIKNQSCMDLIQRLCSDPIAPARAWLHDNARSLYLTTSLGITVKDAYMQYCILDLLDDESLIYYDPTLRLFSWYHGSPPPGLNPFPPDCDCNSLACSIFPHVEPTTKHRIMDAMLTHLESSGIITGYLSSSKVRLDILMCVNGLALFHQNDRGHEVIATEDFIYNVLVNRAFRNGSHYYPSPDIFLYFVSRLLLKAPLLRPRFSLILRDCMLERREADCDDDALALASRVIASARCGMRDDSNLEKLLRLQRDDGSWDAGIVYQFTRKEGVAWHQGFTVAMAVRAIEEWEELRKRKEKEFS